MAPVALSLAPRRAHSNHTSENMHRKESRVTVVKCRHRKKRNAKRSPEIYLSFTPFPVGRNGGGTFFPCQPFPPLRSVLCFPLRPSISFPHSPKGRSERRRRRGNRRWMRWRSSVVDEAAGGRPTPYPLSVLSLSLSIPIMGLCYRLVSARASFRVQGNATHTARNGAFFFVF